MANLPEEVMRSERKQDYLNALMVYDVTLACLEPFIQPHMKNLLAGQINAARDAYKEVTGQEPLELRSRI